MRAEYYDLTEPNFASPTDVGRRRPNQPGSPSRRSSWTHTGGPDYSYMVRFCACMLLRRVALIRPHHGEPPIVLGRLLVIGGAVLLIDTVYTPNTSEPLSLLPDLCIGRRGTCWQSIARSREHLRPISVRHHSIILDYNMVRQIQLSGSILPALQRTRHIPQHLVDGSRIGSSGLCWVLDRFHLDLSSAEYLLRLWYVFHTAFEYVGCWD